MRRLVILALAPASAVALTAAQPAPLAQVSAGLWEISGVPGSRAPVRQCIGDVLTFAQFEHRSRHCTRTMLGSSASSASVSYECAPGNFGQSEIRVITPRSLRISTQGLTEQLPFNYVLQAHRVGDCAKSSSSSRH